MAHSILKRAEEVIPMIKRSALPETTEAPPLMGTALGWADLEPSLPHLLRRLEPIGLEQLAAAALLDRIETKFIFHQDRLPEILAGLTDEYRVLKINDSSLNHYQTLYFDTPGFALYLRHHAGGRNRYKVRSRAYLDTDLAFMEVKHKVSDDRTVKSRIRTAELVKRISPGVTGFLNTHLPATDWSLEPKLWNQYTRVTLLGKNGPERVTLDLDLQYLTDDGRVMMLPGLVIGEVKQDGSGRNSAFIRQMRAMSIRPASFSKYCIGVAMLYGQVKHNRFRPTLRLVDKILQEDSHVN